MSDTSNYNFTLDGKKLGIQLAQLTSKVAPTDGEFIDKIVPLSKEVVSTNLTEKEEYWMNSPLIGKQ